MSAAPHDIHEYMCPHCGCINGIRHDAILNMYKEQIALCDGCGQQLELTAADGINEQVNLIVSVAQVDEHAR